MNILINKYCNLSCSYCFAKTIIHDSTIPYDMPLEDFSYCLDFIDRSKEFLDYKRQVRILGGEPTVSKMFKDYCDIISKNTTISEVVIFSNGLIPSQSMEAIFELSNKKEVKILINTNSPEFLNNQFAELEQNIATLIKNKININLGLNISGENFDFCYFIELLKKYNLKFARWALVSPNENSINQCDPLEYYQKHINVVMQFLRQCFCMGIKTFVDCNVIPICAYSDEQLREFVMYDTGSLIRKRCMPVLDVLPNLKTLRCFGTSHLGSCNLRDFNNIKEVYDYFIGLIDKKVNEMVYTSRCKSCKLHEFNKCGGGCIAFHLPGV